jgi:hypothetical protein
MVELRSDELVFSFPEVHPHAVLRVGFQRTLRIPDDDRSYPLPPGLGLFPLRHVDDFATRVPDTWLTRGGVMLPMYQSEAMWLHFSSPRGYPFAVKVGTGKINAVTGESWTDALSDRPQDYVSIPEQPWLDGYCVEKGVIRQFVAMPLGSGYSVEEQLTGEAEHGGVQLLVHPLKADKYRERPRLDFMVASAAMPAFDAEGPDDSLDMGLAPGGRMEQEIYDDPHRLRDWNTARRGRCFVHLTNALVWRAVTGDDPPTVPPTAAEYTRAGLPWFDYYAADRQALEGGHGLKGIRSVTEMGKAKGDVPLPENEAVDPKNVVKLRAGLKKGEVREGVF